ncbi:MAG: phage tail tape measure protein [Pseudomonadota bacterium]
MNMKLFLELVARSSGFRSELNNSGRAVTRFTQGAKREFQELRRMAGTVQGKLAGIGLTFGAVKIAADSARLDKSLTQIGQTAGASAKEVSALRQDLFRMGRDSGQGIENLKGGFDALVQSGLDMKESKSTLDGINVAMAVTGANAETLAGGLTVAAQAFQFDLSKPGQALELLDKMTVAGRLGNAELENLSGIFARVGVNALSAGMGFDKTLAFIEGLSKVERQPERLATLVDSTLRVFTNAAYMKSAQKATGIRYFDAKGARRDALDIMQDIKKQYDTLTTDQQRFEFISKAFGKADLDTIKGIRTLMSGDILPQVKKMHGTIKEAGGTLKHDFSEATRNLIDQTGMLKNDLREAADGFVKPINEALGRFVQHLRKPKGQGGMGLDGNDMIVGGLGVSLSVLLAGRYGKKALGGLAQKLLNRSGSVAMGVTEGKVLEAAAGVSPVFVVNWPANLGGIIPGGGVPGKGGASSLLPFLSASSVGSIPAIGTAIVGGGSIAMGKHLAEKEAAWRSTQDLMEMRSRQMVMGGGPRSFQVRTIDAELAKRQVKNDIKIDIQIDDRGRVTTKTTGMNNSVNTMKRGSFFDAITAMPAGY